MEQDSHESEARVLSVDTPLNERLKSWLDFFDWCYGVAAQWGLIDYWRDEGIIEKHHGIVLTLDVDVLELSKTKGELNLRQLREAIDLVQIVLAVQPDILRCVLDGQHEELYPDIEAIYRGVPVDLRVTISAGGVSMSTQESFFGSETASIFDSDLSTNEAFLTVRQELMERIDGDESKLRQLNNKTTRAVVEVGWESSQSTCDARFTRLLDSLTAFPEVLSNHRRARGFLARAAPMTSRSVHFEIEKVTLWVEYECITPAVVESVTKLAASTLPVVWESFSLGFGRVGCDEDQLCRFLGAVSELSTSLHITAGHKPTEALEQTTTTFVDESGEDHRESIRRTFGATLQRWRVDRAESSRDGCTSRRQAAYQVPQGGT